MEDDPPPQKLKLGEARFENVNQPSKDRTDDAPMDVHQILQSNLRSTLPGEKPLDLTRRPSRRKRDYWITMLSTNAFFLGVLLVLPRNVVVVMFTLAGVVMANLVYAWVFLCILDD